MFGRGTAQSVVVSGGVVQAEAGDASLFLEGEAGGDLQGLEGLDVGTRNYGLGRVRSCLLRLKRQTVFDWG